MALPSFLPSSYLGIFITLCSPSRQREAEGERLNANTLFYPSETVLSKKITRKRMVLSFKDSPWKPLGGRPRQTKRLPPQKAPKNPISKGRKKEHRTFHRALGVKLHRKKRSICGWRKLTPGKGLGESECKSCAITVYAVGALACVCTRKWFPIEIDRGRI